jgi:hypothetical protein
VHQPLRGGPGQYAAHDSPPGRADHEQPGVLALGRLVQRAGRARVLERLTLDRDAFACQLALDVRERLVGVVGQALVDRLGGFEPTA